MYPDNRWLRLNPYQLHSIINLPFWFLSLMNGDSLENITRYLSEKDEETLSKPTYLSWDEMNETFTGFLPDGEGKFLIKGE